MLPQAKMLINNEFVKKCRYGAANTASKTFVRPLLELLPRANHGLSNKSFQKRKEKDLCLRMCVSLRMCFFLFSTNQDLIHHGRQSARRRHFGLQ